MRCIRIPFVTSQMSNFLFCSCDEDDTGSYVNPYRFLICSTSLAASVKVNSVVRPSLNPALSAQVSVSMLEIKLTNHLNTIGQGTQYSTP